LIGTQIMAYACEEDKRHWQELQAAMWQPGKPNFKPDARLWTKDKALIWVHVTTVTFKENGVTYAHTVLDDFTAWKKLQESDERLSMALAYSKMAVWELDRRDRSITCSEGFDHLFGDMHPGSWNEEMLVGLFFPEDQLKLKAIIGQLRPEENFDFQGRIQTAEGVVKWINLQGRAEKQRILGTLYDITRDKLAEREKDDFISIASHELKTPLTALKGSLQLLERMKDSAGPMKPALLDQANKSMNKVALLVDELLNAGRASEGQLQLKKTTFNLSKAIDECCLHVTATGIHHLIIEGDKDVAVEADPERIQRVIVNFVNNAVKYAPIPNLLPFGWAGNLLTRGYP
jgi:two-component system CheB/CheR fusion protein